MRTYFDKFAKEIGEEALRPSGTTVAHDEITPQPQYADLRHEPDPAQQAARDRLGLLGAVRGQPLPHRVLQQGPER